MKENKVIVLSGKLFGQLTQPINVRVKVKDYKFEAPVALEINKYVDISNHMAFIFNTKVPSFGNMFDCDSEAVTFAAKPERQLYNMDTTFTKRGRQSMKPSKFVKVMIDLFELRSQINGSIIEKPEVINRFIEMMSMRIENRMVFPIQVTGDISDIYNTETAFERAGTLGKSCMRPETKFLCKDNTGVFGMLEVKVAYMLNESGQLISRALLWDNCKFGNYKRGGTNFKLMDRIYGTGHAENAMKKWARENGYAYKMYQTFDRPQLENAPFTGEENYWIELPPGGFNTTRVPYFDSLKYHDPHSNRMCAYNDTGRHLFLVQNCAGSLIGTVTCPVCGRNAHPDGLYDIKLRGISGTRTCCDYCTTLTIDNERAFVNDVGFSRIHNGYIHYNNAIKLVDCGDYVRNSDEELREEVGPGKYVASKKYKLLINEQSKYAKNPKRKITRVS